MWFRRFYGFYSALLSKTQTMNLKKCYFRHNEADDKIEIHFLLDVRNSMRQFNLVRNPTETTSSLCARIGTNVKKVLYKKKEAVGKEVMVTICNDKGANIPENLTCNDLFKLDFPLKLIINEHNTYDLIFNAPWVASVNLPQSILAGFPVYPENYVAYNAAREKSLFQWYKSPLAQNPKNEENLNWVLVNDKFLYTPSVEDIGCKLKLECVPGNDRCIGPAVEAISKSGVEAGPGHCPFEDRHMFTKNKLRQKSFRCVSYNILADLYCDSDYTRTVLHPYCPPYALSIDYRKQIILKELIGYNADIICLQEVDVKIFNHCLKPILAEENLEGCFSKKGKEVAEGLACFYRKDRFRLLAHETVILSEALKTHKCLETIWNIVKENKPFVERLLDRSTAASVLTFQSKDNENELLLVGNTHLYFHPDADHIRVTQGGIVIYWLSYVKSQLLEKYPDKRVSLIVCGDFNSVPSCGIYKLYTTGEAPRSLPDWSSNESEAVYNLDLKQEIKLDSACGTPKYTNFTDCFADCLDYIYYETTNLEVEQVVPFPSEEELRAHVALPSIVFPSDHIALVSDLKFI